MKKGFGMPRTSLSGSDVIGARVDWADPGYFSGQSAAGNALRILVQLVRPPRGHRTLPTRTGLMLIILTIGVGTAAFNTGQNILYLALALFLSTLLVSGMLSWLNFKGCRWRLESGQHFRTGATSPVYLIAENRKKRLPSYDLTFHLRAELSETKRDLVLPAALEPGEKARLLWEFVPERRGRETLRVGGLVSRYPFGFLKKSIRDSLEREVTVWPARIPYQFSAGRPGQRWLHGQHRRRGEGVELIQLREYRGGDSLKHIHWKASARMGRLQVRETLQEDHQAFALEVDPSERLWTDPEQFERMCAFAGSLAEDLFQSDQLKAVQIAGILSRPVGTIGDLYQFLDNLAGLERGDTGRGFVPGRRTRETIRFLPGPDRRVMAQLEEEHVGQA